MHCSNTREYTYIDKYSKRQQSVSLVVLGIGCDSCELFVGIELAEHVPWQSRASSRLLAFKAPFPHEIF
jgi:hypothetical protein